MHNAQKLLQSVYLAGVSILLLAGCGSDGENDWSNSLNPPATIGTGECTVAETNQWIHEAMHDRYLWYRFTPTLDYNSYSDPATLLGDLRYSELDRYSFLMSEQDYLDSQQGVTTAFGFRFGYTDGRILFFHIEPGSPSAHAGLQRGDELLKIGGYDIDSLSRKQLNELLDTGNGPNTQSFTVTDRDKGTTRSFEMTSTEFPVQTVFKTDIRSIAGITTGYIGFSRFLNTSAEELTAAFRNFSEQGVQELILDMRYNGGGLIYIASQLAGFIGGQATEGETFATLNFNDRYADQDFRYNFTTTDEALGLQRVFVLTTGSTCSASEMVINGLKPYLNVVVIGDNSCGKPVGMTPETQCGNALFAINFETRNSLGEGGFYDGFTPDCSVSDLPETDMWDDKDALFSAASNYIVQSSCPASQGENASTRSTREHGLFRPMKPKAPEWKVF